MGVGAGSGRGEWGERGGAGMVDKFVFAALCLALFLLPLPYGAVEEWAIYAFEAVTLTLFAITAARGLGRGAAERESGEEESGPPGRRERRPVPLALKVMAGLFFGVVALQIVPLPVGIVRAVSPRAVEIAEKGRQAVLPILEAETAEGAGAEAKPGAEAETSAAAGDRQPAFRTLSLAPALTAYELIKYICYFLFAWLVYRHVRTRRQTEIFVWVLMGAGLFQAIYGLTQLWGGTGRIFAWKNAWNQGSAFGTYINRDHFSGFLEMIFPLSLGYLLSKARFFAMKPGLSTREKILWYSQERLQKTAILAMLSVMLGLGIIFSRCRAGILNFLISLFLISLVASAAGGGTGRRGRERGQEGEGESGSERVHAQHARHSAGWIRSVSMGVVAVAVVVGLNPVISRFTKENVTFDKGRVVYYKNSLELAGKFAAAGSGAGTFVHAYPLVEKEDAPGLLTHAHNDYLEILAETGFVGGGALILAGLGMVGLMFARWLRRRDHFARGIALGAMGGIVALMIHGMLDFNLRIPANAVYFFVLFALALRALRLPGGVRP